MKKILSFFIKYDIAVNLLIIGFLYFGVFGALSMRSSFFPLISSHFISIDATYPGASPQEIEEGIILKIEDNLKGISGVDRVSSYSSENFGKVTVELFFDEDINILLQEVKNAVDKIPSFPTGMEPLVVSKREEIAETMSFVISGDNIELSSLKQIGRGIENDLRSIDGISEIEVYGYPEEEIEIALRENDMRAYNLSFQQISDAIQKTNLLTTGGTIKADAEEYLIRANNRAYHAIDLDYLIVSANNDGQIIRLKDVATVTDRFSETPNYSYLNGNISVNIVVSNTSKEDLLDSAAKLNVYIKNFNQSHDNLRIDVVRDSSVTLRQRTELLAENGAVGILLVLVFLSLFLNTRLAFWVAFGIPISFLGMFMFADMLNVTINVLSLFGMIIVIGILVDDGIVIAENIYQHYEKGKSPVKATIDGTLEVLPSIISAIITTMLAFSVFLFLDGRIGTFFSEISIVVMLTLSVSLIEALLILPAHIAHSKAFKKDGGASDKKQNYIQQFFSKMRDVNKFGDWVMKYLRDKFYAKVLKLALNNRFITLSIFIGLLMFTFSAIGSGVIKSSFFPMIASDRVTINLTMPQGTNEKITDSIISHIEQICWEVNDEYTEKQTGNKQVVKNIVKRLGSGSAKGMLRLNLLEGEARDFSSPEITKTIRERVGEVVGVESLTFGSGGNFGGSPVSVSLLGSNRKELKAAKEELLAILRANPKLKDVNDNDPKGIKEIKIKLKENAYLMGFNLQMVLSQVRAGFFGLQVQRFQRGQDEIKVWVRYDRADRSSIYNLDNMQIVSPIGKRVPLKEIATYTIERGEVQIYHLDNQREITITADISNAKVSASTIMDNIKNIHIPNIQSKYSSIKPSFEGQQREFNKISKSAGKIVPVILFLMYLVIAFAFKSYTKPIILLLMIPFSLIGVAWGHSIHGMPINILSWLGIIALLGIMVNDGLVFIEKYNSCMKEGMGYKEALFETGITRFRAIFLTSITTIAGLAPLLLEKSRQAQFLIPMAISISYGIAIATILTLVMLPILLSCYEAVYRLFKKKD